MSIEIKNITKKFGKNTVLDNVTVSFNEKRIYGLLGRNGAGKSTLLNIVSGRIYQTEGDVLIDGEIAKDNYAAQSKIFLMSEQNLYPASMRISEIIKWTKEFYPDADSERAKQLAELFKLDIKKRYSSLSTGYKNIAKFIMAITSNAKYTFLDEPVLGVDANHRELIYKIIIEEYSENPRAIIIATHLIDEITSLLEDVVIIRNGKIIENESVESLLSRGYTVTGSVDAIDSFVNDKNLIGTDTLGGVKIAYILSPLEKASVPEGLEVTGLNLQKLFVKLTGETEELK